MGVLGATSSVGTRCGVSSCGGDLQKKGFLFVPLSEVTSGTQFLDIVPLEVTLDVAVGGDPGGSDKTPRRVPTRAALFLPGRPRLNGRSPVMTEFSPVPPQDVGTPRVVAAGGRGWGAVPTPGVPQASFRGGPSWGWSAIFSLGSPARVRLDLEG